MCYATHPIVIAISYQYISIILVDHIGIKLYSWMQTINWKTGIYSRIVFQDHLFIALFSN